MEGNLPVIVALVVSGFASALILALALADLVLHRQRAERQPDAAELTDRQTRPAKRASGGDIFAR